MSKAEGVSEGRRARLCSLIENRMLALNVLRINSHLPSDVV
jgi:hypothetical protein